MSKIFAISDLHFGHARIIEYCNRPFTSVDEMDAALVANWNSVVGDEDTVIFGGDFQFYKDNRGHFNSLKGRKVLVKGNHDHAIVFGMGWESIHDILEIKHSNRKFVICHYPLHSWNRSTHGSTHLYGHVHDNDAPTMNNRYNMCVERINYTPKLLESF